MHRVNMAKISIIIPVYNSCSFLNDCVQSVLQQTFSDIEIWLIDDGSTDKSGSICDYFASVDARVCVVHTENHGAAYARQLGVERAKGEFLCFVDSDDSMPSDGLERLYQAACRHEQTDIVVGFCREHNLLGKNKLLAKKYRELLIEGRHNIGTLWGKLFRRTLFSHGIPTLPPQLIMGEDMLINIYLAFASEQQVQLVKGKRIYNYIQRDTGISRRFHLTAAYENAFHQERLRVIPEHLHDTYMYTMIHRRLRMLRRLFAGAKKDQTLDELRHSPFVEVLVKDIKRYQYACWRYPRPSLWKFLSKVR